MARKLTNFRLPEDLLEAMRDRASAKGISLTELLVLACQRELVAGVDTSEYVKQAVGTDVIYNELQAAIASIASLEARYAALTADVEKFNA